MNSILNAAIHSVQNAKSAFCRFITGNDTGTTGSHQSGFYIPKCASEFLFDVPCKKGENKEKTVKIKWQDAFTTESRMIYYGRGTRNEYRITRFGRGFPFLQDENIGDLLVMVKYTDEDYSAYVLSADEDIDTFFAYFNLSSDETNQLIDTSGTFSTDSKLLSLLNDFISNHDDFPDTELVAICARESFNKANMIDSSDLINIPDDILLAWIDTEFKLFRLMEEKYYSNMISKPFRDMESFVKTANEVLNRRKSRAGKSLEHHLADLFMRNGLIFEAQAITEDNKKPDFIFPNGECYHNLLFPTDYLTVLGAKTTCKDRWRQVITEANRVDVKYLFTLQQGVSRNQLKEMHDSNLRLVVPKKYISCFPKDYQNEISDLAGFISFVRERQEHISKYYTLC